MRNERQNHGFIFEEILKKEYSLKDSNDIKYDAFKDNFPISIKTSKLNKNKNFNICLSSVYNQIDLKSDYITLVIGLYREQQQIKNMKSIEDIENVLAFKIPRNEWLRHFNIDLVKRLEKEKTYLKYKANNKQEQKKTQKEWRKYISTMKRQWNKEERKAIQLNFKRDSKGQCRVQCSITKRNLIDNFGKYQIEIN